MAGNEYLAQSIDAQLDREWLITNGIGGYASSTIPGLNTRKYHGLLVAVDAPLARPKVILSHLEDRIVFKGQSIPLSRYDDSGVRSPELHRHLRAFAHTPFPRWAYQGDGWTIEKQLRLSPHQNAVCMSYTLLGGASPLELAASPLFALRGVHRLRQQWNDRLSTEHCGKDMAFSHHSILPTSRTPEVFFTHDGRFESASDWGLNSTDRRADERHQIGSQEMWKPGRIRWILQPGQSVNFICGTDLIDLRCLENFHRHEEPSGCATRSCLLSPSEYSTVRHR